MALLALYAVALSLGVCLGIESRYSVARLYVGRAIVSETFLQKRPRGMQDAITDPSGNVLYYLGLAAFAVTLVVSGWYFHWAHVVGLIGTCCIAAAITISVLPAPDDLRYAYKIMGNLAKREANYRKENDLMRADATKRVRADIAAMIAMKELNSVGENSSSPLHSQKIGPVNTEEDQRLVAACEAAIREKRSRGD